MRQKQLYQWFESIREGLPHLSKPQAMVLAIFSMGVVLAEHCAANKVAEHLGWLGRADSLERRFQRFLNNNRISMETSCRMWSAWVMRTLSADSIILLVDETKLGEWLGVMMVGLAYRQRCIPLAWMCYRSGAWPMKQVDMIGRLLAWVKDSIPAGVTPVVMADRGIGTSPGLVRAIAGMGWYYLFRVQSQTRFRFKQGHDVALKSLARRARSWSCTGHVFKKAGWLLTRVHIIWKATYDEPWFLITNSPLLDSRWYAMRAWQEHGFRDLKSGGWQWQRSQVRIPDHAHILILVLALAYAWMLTLGLVIEHATPALQRTIWRGQRCPYSIFRRGHRFFYHLFEARKPILTQFLFIPLKL